MSTEPLYYADPYATAADARIVAIEPKGLNRLIEVDRTIFYPEGGGQPSDQGEIIGTRGRVRVDFVQYRDGRIIHQGRLDGQLAVGEGVKLALKWGSRHHNMRTHTAGHLIHDVLMGMTDALTPNKGSHGNKAYLQYSGRVEEGMRDQLEIRSNEGIAADLPVLMKDSSYDEIVATCKFVPPGLPRNKPLRTLQIGTFPPMPDGGVHVRSTKEIGRIVIQELSSTDEVTVVKYRVSGGSSS